MKRHLPLSFRRGRSDGSPIDMVKALCVDIELDEDGYYVATVPKLPGCHTQARSLPTLMERVQEAVELCLEVEEEATC